MTKYRILPFGLAALALAWFAALGAVAEDKPAGDRTGSDRTGKGTNSNAHVYKGKIVRVNADKGILVVGNIMHRGGKGKGTGAGTGAGTGTGAGKSEGAGAGSSKGEGTGAGTAGSGTRDSDSGKGKVDGRTMTFMITKARISLDGKDATIRDLKQGLYVRVHADRAANGDNGKSGGTRGSGTTPAAPQEVIPREGAPRAAALLAATGP